MAAGDSSLSAYHPRTEHLSIGRLRQGVCRVRLQTAAGDAGIWLGCGDTAVGYAYLATNPAAQLYQR